MSEKLSERTPKSKLDALKALPDDELLAKAWAEISALCGAGKGPQKRWTMSVPVDADRDSDVLFGEVLRRYAALEQRVEGLEDGLRQIVEWSKAYPLDVFPEPDFKKAAELLKVGGMTLDAISASNMRHVVEGVGGIAKEALAQEEARSSVEP